LRPKTPYAVSKMAAEQYVLAIGALWEIETVILRVFNAYGPGQPLPPSHAPVVPQFLKQALEGGSLVLYGSGRQTRDFVYISDVVDALVSAAQTPDIDRTIANVGSGTGVSIRGLADVVAEVTQRRIHRLHNPSQSGGVSWLVADVSLAREKLGFSPRVTLHEGLSRILAVDPVFRGK